jgi:hypothetical protein
MAEYVESGRGTDRMVETFHDARRGLDVALA